jgi:hypothetical protein
MLDLRRLHLENYSCPSDNDPRIDNDASHWYRLCYGEQLRRWFVMTLR